jgi:hypothetical protein
MTRSTARRRQSGPSDARGALLHHRAAPKVLRHSPLYDGTGVVRVRWGYRAVAADGSAKRTGAATDVVLARSAGAR